MRQPRFVLSDHADKNGERLIYDVTLGRGESIGSIDDAYAEMFERAFKEGLGWDG